MTIEQARALAKALNDAADIAQASGVDVVKILDTLKGVDDAARAELDAAIARQSTN